MVRPRGGHENVCFGYRVHADSIRTNSAFGLQRRIERIAPRRIGKKQKAKSKKIKGKSIGFGMGWITDV
jgi:hypothetical protein